MKMHLLCLSPADHLIFDAYAPCAFRDDVTESRWLKNNPHMLSIFFLFCLLLIEFVARLLIYTSRNRLDIKIEQFKSAYRGKQEEEEEGEDVGKRHFVSLSQEFLQTPFTTGLSAQLGTGSPRDLTRTRTIRTQSFTSHQDLHIT